VGFETYPEYRSKLKYWIALLSWFSRHAISSKLARMSKISVTSSLTAFSLGSVVAAPVIEPLMHKKGTELSGAANWPPNSVTAGLGCASVVPF